MEARKEGSRTERGARIPVAVMGATGTVGQRLVSLLADHPWFELAVVAASERSAGKRYGEAARWVLPTPLPEAARDLEVRRAEPVLGCPLVFSALDAVAARELEPACAREGALVVSNAASHRMEPRVPLIVPEVNPGHLELLAQQDFGAGALVTNPNCTTIGLVLALDPLQRAFGLRRVHVVSLQAVSGAGLPGVASLEILDNVIPFIADEEPKVEREARKILGRLDPQGILPADLTLSATCTRVPVLDAHTLCVSVELERDAEPAELLAAWRTFRGVPQELDLPSAPRAPVHVHDAPDAPQPRLCRDLERGMAAHVGRLRPCPLLGWKFVTLSHNTQRGAAGGTLLVAELARARGLVDAGGFRR